MITKSIRPKTWHKGIRVQYLVEANITFLQNTQMSSANRLVPNTMRNTAPSILSFNDTGYLIPTTVHDRWTLNLLTNSMEESPGEANHLSVSLEIPHIPLPFDPSLILSSHICLDLPSGSSFPQVSPPLPCIRLSSPPPTRYMPCPFHSSRFYHSNNIG